MYLFMQVIYIYNQILSGTERLSGSDPISSTVSRKLKSPYGHILLLQLPPFFLPPNTSFSKNVLHVPITSYVLKEASTMYSSPLRGKISAFIYLVTAVVVIGKVHPDSITASIFQLLLPCKFDRAFDFTTELSPTFAVLTLQTV